MAPEVEIPDSEICSSSGGPITIDRIEVSQASIPSVSLKDFSGSFTYASAKAKNVDIEMTITINSTFTGKVINLPDWIPDQSVNGGIDFDPFTQINSLGDVDMSGGSFTMKAKDMSFGPFSMKPDPIGNGSKTTVAEMKVEKIDMHCTEIPLQNPLGITLGDSFPIQNPMGPMDIKVKETRMDELDSDKVTIPPATMRNIVAQNIKIPTMTTGPMEVDSNTPVKVVMTKSLYDSGAHPYGDAANQKITSTVTVNVQGVKLKIKGGLEFKGVAGSVTASSAASSAPFDVNLVFKGLKNPRPADDGIEPPGVGSGTLSSKRRSRRVKVENPQSDRTKYLTKEEFGRIDGLWEKEKEARGDRNPDKHHFFDLVYLGFLGHIKNRGRVEEDLKELKRMLDKTADKMMEIVDKSEAQTGSK